MDAILARREEIYDHFQRSAGPKFFFVTADKDRYAAYYTSMYLIADTAESIKEHRRRDFSSDPFLSYLEFWGVMQAVVIQQDAIVELNRAIAEISLAVAKPSAWWNLREFRNQCAGHPANRSRGVPASQRSFMGRTTRKYSRVQYELWDAQTQQTTHPIVDLAQMLDDYDLQASQLMATILQIMKAQWP